MDMRRLVRPHWLWGLLLFLGSAFVLLPPARAGDEEKPAVNGKNSRIQLSGVGWATYRYQLSLADSARTPHGVLPSEDMNSFDLDRLYLTADYALNERISWQTQLEAANLGGTASLFVKKAFLRLKDPFGLKGTSFKLGQIAHVMTPVAEDAWGFRSVSKVPIDRYLGISTTWVGVGMEGKALKGGLEFDGSVTNENAYNRTSSTKYKTFQGRVTLVPLPADETMKGLKLSVFAQMNPKTQPPSLKRVHRFAPDTTGYVFTYAFKPSASDNNNLWIGLFPHYRSEHFVVGFEIDQKRDKHAAPVDPEGKPTQPRVNGEIGSATVTSRYLGGFVAGDVTDRLRLFARADRFDPNTDSESKDDGYLTLLGGIAHTHAKGVRGILDLEYTRFDKLATLNGMETKKTLDPDITLSARMEVSL